MQVNTIICGAMPEATKDIPDGLMFMNCFNSKIPRFSLAQNLRRQKPFLFAPSSQVSSFRFFAFAELEAILSLSSFKFNVWQKRLKQISRNNISGSIYPHFRVISIARFRLVNFPVLHKSTTKLFLEKLRDFFYRHFNLDSFAIHRTFAMIMAHAPGRFLDAYISLAVQYASQICVSNLLIHIISYTPNWWGLQIKNERLCK